MQRAGRCNRDGFADGARLLWTPPPAGRTSHLPYGETDLARTEETLTRLDGMAVTSEDLAAQAPDSEPPLHPVLRRRDLLGLFDTAPDLSGNDIDVSQFVRDSDNRTVSVAWRPPTQEHRQAARLAPCPSPPVRTVRVEPAVAAAALSVLAACGEAVSPVPSRDWHAADPGPGRANPGQTLHSRPAYGNLAQMST